MDKGNEVRLTGKRVNKVHRSIHEDRENRKMKREREGEKTGKTRKTGKTGKCAEAERDHPCPLYPDISDRPFCAWQS